MKTEFYEDFKDRKAFLAYLRKQGETLQEHVSRRMPKEVVFQSKILDALERWKKSGSISKDAVWWKNGGASLSNMNGLPDIMCCVDGLLICLEVKRPFVGKASDLQLAFIDKVNRAGGQAAVGCYPSEMRRLFERAGCWKGASDDCQ